VCDLTFTYLTIIRLITRIYTEAFFKSEPMTVPFMKKINVNSGNLKLRQHIKSITGMPKLALKDQSCGIIFL